jgi:IMP dehydrogenase
LVTFAVATYYPEPSHTFSEYLLLPNLTRKTCTAASISLATPLAKFRKGEKPAITLNIPFASAIGQAVSGYKTGIALARSGGSAFIFVSQPVEKQAEMVERVKKFKVGFVASDSNQHDHELHVGSSCWNARDRGGDVPLRLQPES